MWMLLALQAPPNQPRPLGTGFFLVQMLLIFGIIYFLLIRPRVKQEREHRARVAELKKGDEVVTAGGIVGEVIHLKDDRVTIKSNDSRLVVMRDRIADIPSARSEERTT